MTEPLGWIIPALVVFGAAALGVVAAAWALRRAQRSPRARAAAEQVRGRAGAVLVRLDDAVDELDLEVGLSGALYGGGAPASLRRARMTAQHVRDASFEEYRALTGDTVAPDEMRRAATRIERRATAALAGVEAARADHAAWTKAHVSAETQVEAARARLRELRTTMGDPDALVADLSARFAEGEWAAAARSARAATEGADEVEHLLARAAADAQDPTRSALADLAAAERRLRAAETDARSLEESHRLVHQAALALPGEFESARNAVRGALTTRVRLDPDAAARLGAELRAIDAALSDLETDAARHPTRSVDAIARLRGRLDLALGDAWTAQQRLRGARTALPGTLAAARAALVAAEASVTRARAGAEARTRLLSAQAELANARQSADPVAALDAARRAMRDAEDAKALADHDRLAEASAPRSLS
ncbi:hypothetical protein ACFC3F_10965 [Microbacterium sp. NPDC055910]|uniref:hypothetical protein n=1 Tax=Microbacterium sp. NPDC055910 TaxID=3345659 RepID=UPI0035DF44D8